MGANHQALLMISGAAADFGALVNRSGTYTRSTSEIPWDSEQYDLNGWHDTSSTALQKKLSVISGVTLARFVTSHTANSGVPEATTTLNNAGFRGGPAKTLGSGSFFAIAGAPVVVTLADYFQSLTTTVDISAGTKSWAFVEKLDPALLYCLAYRSTNLSITGGTSPSVGFDSEVVDTSSFHDNVTNNDRFTVPSTGCYRFTINGDLSNAGGRIQPIAAKNGSGSSGFSGGFHSNQSRGAAMYVNASTAPIEMTAGDYFSLTLNVDNTRTLSAAGYTWACVEQIPSSYQRVLCFRSANQSFTSGVAAAVQWDGADGYDTASMHDPASSNTEVTVPSGCNWARTSFNIIFPTVNSTQAIVTFKNGAAVYGGACDQIAGASTGAFSNGPPGAWFPVVPGDKLTCVITTGENLTLGNNTRTWFAVECRA